MKRILLTGASGFIGYHCIAPLRKRGYEVHAASRSVPKDGSSGAIWHEADLLDTPARASLLEAVQPSHLLHLAWFVVPGQLITSPENFAWVTASLDLVQRFAALGGKRAVVCGSGYEYDWNYGYCSEAHTPTVPNTVYGACKHALDVMLRALAPEQKLSLAWGRVFFLYGPREHPKRLVSSVILSLLRGEPAKCSHGRQVRDYMHVQDVADGMSALLDSDLEGPVNVSSGQATTIRDIVLTTGRLLGKPELIQLGALPARANDTPLVVGDNTRITTTLGWQPRYDLESGLEQTAAWWRDHMPAPA